MNFVGFCFITYYLVFLNYCRNFAYIFFNVPGPQARPLLAQALEDGCYDTLVDPRLQRNYDAVEMSRMISCAAACVRHSAWLRPRMIQVNFFIPNRITQDGPLNITFAYLDTFC